MELNRLKSAGELYTYLPPTPSNAHQLSPVPPLSKEGGDYGYSVGRGSFHLGRAVGRWMSVACWLMLGRRTVRDVSFLRWSRCLTLIRRNNTLHRRLPRYVHRRIIPPNSWGGKIYGNAFSDFLWQWIRSSFNYRKFWLGLGLVRSCRQDQRAWFADVTGVIVDVEWWYGSKYTCWISSLQH